MVHDISLLQVLSRSRRAEFVQGLVCNLVHDIGKVFLYIKYLRRSSQTVERCCKGMGDFAQILCKVCPSPCSGVAQGSLSDFWRWYLSFWWLGQPNTSYCILSEERGNAV